MTRVIVPELDKEPWPTLGPEVVDWIEAHLCHGPGDVLGQPVTLTDEERLFLYRVYEVHPRSTSVAGRRRFKRAVYSRRKGARKTEFAAWIAIAESHPDAPVRADGFRQDGGVWVPVGRGVSDPYIPMVAYTEEQVEDLAYAAVYEILAHCELGNDYDLGLERIVLRAASGKIQPLASAPSARDGARTTWQHFDETHLMNSPRLRKAHATMLLNIPKRRIADAWSLETTTMYEPGEGSVAEGTHRYAEDIISGGIKDPDLFFDHRQAADSHNLKTKKGRRAAVKEASGDAILWTDFNAVESQWNDPQISEAAWRRFWGNQRWSSEDRWISPSAWADRHDPKTAVDAGEEIIIGFWGEASRSSAGMVGCTRKGHLFVIGAWDHSNTKLRVTREEVEDALSTARSQYTITEIVTSIQGGMGWISEVQQWAADDLGVVELPINSPARMGPACTRFKTAVLEGDLSHDGHLILARHLANAVPATSNYGDYIRPGPGGPISSARAAILAYDRALSEHDSEEDMFLVVVDSG